MNDTYTISILDPAPAMTDSFVEFTGTYREAVALAQSLWRKHGRSICVRSGKDRAGHWYHRIAAGIAIDRNTNSGVLAETKL